MSKTPIAEIDYALAAKEPYFVSFSCGSCHSGQVMVAGKPLTLEGSPNTQFDVRKWRKAFTLTRAKYLDDVQIGTAEKPAETVIKLREIIDSKPPGYFARGLPGLKSADVAIVDASQRAFTKAALIPILKGLAAATDVRSAAVALQTRPGSSYGHAGRSPGLAGESAGQSDGSGDLMVDLIAQRALPKASLADVLRGSYPELRPFATVTDIPSVWQQGLRVLSQWDGSVQSAFWRNIAAQVPIVGDTAKVDLHNTAIVSEFLRSLPPPPYPFKVDLASAARGEKLYRENCADCHRAGNPTIYREVGTDFNRAQVLNSDGTKMLMAAFTAACSDPEFTYLDRYGRTQKPCVEERSRILRDTTDAASQGYPAPPLDGIWARAPYLHNGSVPNLRALLFPGRRPTTFGRGDIDFDATNVGWVSDPDAAPASQAPTRWIYDTRKDGLSSIGHDKDLELQGKRYRLDWSDSSLDQDLRDLLEHLKTL